MDTVEEFYAFAKAELKGVYGSSEVRSIVQLLLEEVTGIRKADGIFQSNRKLSGEQFQKLNSFLSEIKTGKPPQYVLGHAWFFGISLKLNEHVLIPRPETEELCEWILNDLKRTPDPSDGNLSVLDIGTGSGCIAIALMMNLPATDVSAVDISMEALQVARENAHGHDLNINFIRGDILSVDFQKSFTRKYDVIVSNPPYIRKSEMPSVSDGVKNFEPHTALFVDDEDPLLFYGVIGKLAKTILKADGRLFFEINQQLSNDVVALLSDLGYHMQLKKDLSGNYRMVRAVPVFNL